MSAESLMGPGVAARPVDTPGAPNQAAGGAQGNANILQSLKSTEQESHEALKVTYKDLDDDKDNFTKSQENKPEPLTILRKSPH